MALESRLKNLSRSIRRAHLMWLVVPAASLFVPTATYAQSDTPSRSEPHLQNTQSASSDVPTGSSESLEVLRQQARQAMLLRDYGKLVPLLTELAEQGDAESAYQLAGLYRTGRYKAANKSAEGTEVDLHQAAKWAARAAKQGHSGARYLLATLCERGTVCDAERQANIPNQLYQQAADDGYVPAQQHLQRAQQQAERLNKKDPDRFWMAARRGDLNQLQQQRDLGLSVDEADELGRTPLLMAVDAAQLQAVQWLLLEGADPNRRDVFHETPLQLAARRGFDTIVERLLQAGARVNTKDPGGNTALMLAVKSEHPALVKRLLEAGADANIGNLRRDNPLSMARRHEQADIESLLLAHRARMPEQIPVMAGMNAQLRASEQALFDDWPALSVAVWLDQPERAEQLLALGADVNEAGPGGHTALTRAAWRGQKDTVQRLLEAGADVRQTDNQGRSALSWALEQVHPDSSATVAVLLGALKAKVKTDINRQDQDGGFPLWYAARLHGESTSPLDLVKQLLNAGADINLSGPKQQTALLAAIHSSPPDIELIRLLLQSGAQTNPVDESGRDALWYAANAGQLELLPLLIAAGARGQNADSEGHRAIERCVVQGSPECLEQLLPLNRSAAERTHRTRGGNSLLLLVAALPQERALPMLELLLAAGDAEGTQQLDQKNSDGDTALMQAAARGNERVVARLMEAGADPWLRNHSKQSAADLARQSGHEQLAQQLGNQGDKSGYWWKLLTGANDR